MNEQEAMDETEALGKERRPKMSAASTLSPYRDFLLKIYYCYHFSVHLQWWIDGGERYVIHFSNFLATTSGFIGGQTISSNH